MRKGFTLIELLAVIVILAIIALIATPIVLNIVNDTKESSTIRSAEYYLNAVEQSIMKKSMSIGGRFSPKICEIQDDGNLLCDGKDELKIEVNGEKPKSGTIIFEKGKIYNMDITIDEERLIKNDNGEIIYFPCVVKSGDKNIFGSLYECEVKPGTKYNFYVLSQESNGSTNLIMDRNINSDGTLVTEAITQKNAEKGVYNLVEWVKKMDYNDDESYGSLGNNNKGPITAMNYLYNATRDWINMSDVIVDYEDENMSNKNEKGTSGYGSIKTTEGLTKIIKKDGSIVTVLSDKEGYISLKARMPRYDEVYGNGKCLTYQKNNNKNGSCPLWLVNYLESHTLYPTSTGKVEISGIDGYFTLSSSAESTYTMWRVDYSGSVNGFGTVLSGKYGVRPVINIKL